MNIKSAIIELSLSFRHDIHNGHLCRSTDHKIGNYSSNYYMQFKKWTIHNIKYEKPLRNHLKFQQFLTFLLVKSNNFLNDYNFHRLSVKMLYVGAEKCAKIKLLKR